MSRHATHSRQVPPHAQLHGRGDGQVDKVLDYLSFVVKSKPLSVLLDEAPKKIAACVAADVASLYLLEGDGRDLVMRGNVGFRKDAPGKVRLRVGEGITGKAVQLRYPISAASAEAHESYRSFPELGEERFPAFLAVPVLGTSGPLGAVVVQRSAPFSEAEVSLVAALTAPISSGIRLARLLDDLRDKPARRAGAGTRKVTLPGVPAVPGQALGAVAALRRPATSPRIKQHEDDVERLRTSLARAERALLDLADRAAQRKLGEQAKFINNYLLMARDQRLRQRSLELLDQGSSLAAALGDVAREATRTATEQDDAFLIDRARDMEQLCDALLMMSTSNSRAALPSKAVVVADQLSIYDLLVTARTQPVGFVLTERSVRPRTRVLLELLGVPAITDVVNAFRWVAPGDIALVDADHGFLIVNPSRTDIAAHRAARRKEARQSRPESES